MHGAHAAEWQWGAYLATRSTVTEAHTQQGDLHVGAHHEHVLHTDHEHPRFDRGEPQRAYALGLVTIHQWSRVSAHTANVRALTLH